MLDLIGINLYLGTDRLLRPRGGAGVFRKVWCYKTLPPPPKKKITYGNCTPLVITIFRMQPRPPQPSPPPPPRVHAGEEKLARRRGNLGESGEMLPQKLFYKFRVSEMPSPAFSAGHS